MTAAAPIPMTVIGGFLGAGKTTFLNRLLAGGVSRYAVLVNDFGEINVDAALIARHDGTTMALTNGCVCCSIGSGFLDTLGRLLDSGERFERIVIEASGVGDPWRIAEIALIEPALRLDGVIVIADASRIPALIDDRRVGDTVRNQFARCDLVLLSKSDLVAGAELEAARRAVHAVRPDVRIEVLSRDSMPELSCLGQPQTVAVSRRCHGRSGSRAEFQALGLPARGRVRPRPSGRRDQGIAAGAVAAERGVPRRRRCRAVDPADGFRGLVVVAGRSR